MPWFKVDDHFHSNKKVLRIPRNRRCGAVGLWLLVGTWCTANLTDGVVPDYIPVELGGTSQHVRDLVASGLWEVLPDDEHQYPKWEEYQPTRQSTEDRRQAERDRKAEWRERNRGNHGRFTSSEQDVPAGQDQDTDGTPTSVPESSQGGPATPDPTRPDPTRPDPVVPTELPTEKNTSSPAARAAEALAEEFDRFWAAYPRKVGKAAALKAYRSARRKVDIDAVRAALRNSRNAWETGRRPLDRIPHAATWLNSEPWHDDPDAIAPVSPIGDRRQQVTDQTFDQALAWAAQQDQHRQEITA